MKKHKQIEKIEHALFNVSRDDSVDYTPGDKWQQHLMRDIHGIALQGVNAACDVVLPVFIKRIAWTSLFVSLILLISFIAMFNTMFQSRQEQLANDIDTWIANHNAEYNELFIAKNGNY